MDTGQGYFEPAEQERVNQYYRSIAQGKSPVEGVHSIFCLGEKVKIKESIFEVHSIGYNKLTLRLLPREKGEPGSMKILESIPERNGD